MFKENSCWKDDRRTKNYDLPQTALKQMRTSSKLLQYVLPVRDKRSTVRSNMPNFKVNFEKKKRSMAWRCIHIWGGNPLLMIEVANHWSTPHREWAEWLTQVSKMLHRRRLEAWPQECDPIEHQTFPASHHSMLRSRIPKNNAETASLERC